MADETQRWYYNQIKNNNSIENAVDNFWLNLLPDYFKKSLKFGIEHESRPFPEATKQRADWTIRYIKNGDPKVILMEDKRRGKEFSTAEWRSGLEQLTDYMTLARAETQQDTQRTLYGAVNIGTYTRFYQLDMYEKTCINYPGTPDQALELQADEERIHNILQELVQKTMH